jgi:hypothetical protein
VLVIDVVPLLEPQALQLQVCQDGRVAELRFLQNQRLVTEVSAGRVDPELVADLFAAMEQSGLRNSAIDERSRRNYPVEDDVVRMSLSAAENETSFRAGPLSDLPTAVAVMLDRLRGHALSLPEAVTAPVYIRAEPISAARLAALRASPPLKWAVLEEIEPTARSAVEDALRVPFAFVAIKGPTDRLIPTLEPSEDLFIQAGGRAFQLEMFHEQP